jgi:hypothetical protein
MPEPLSDEYLSHAQKVIIGLPKGPWPVQPSEHGLPDQVGPICFLETWSDTERIPVVEFISFAREAVPALFGEVARQRDQIAVLKRQLRTLQRADGGVVRG